MKAVSIYPSSPISFAKGSRKFAIYVKILESPNDIFAKSQITIPIGAATETALAKTNKVLSSKDLTKILPICGFLYGGSSNIKEEGTPLSKVLERSFEIISVKNIPSNIIKITVRVGTMLARKPEK